MVLVRRVMRLRVSPDSCTNVSKIASHREKAGLDLGGRKALSDPSGGAATQKGRLVPRMLYSPVLTGLGVVGEMGSVHARVVEREDQEIDQTHHATSLSARGRRRPRVATSTRSSVRKKSASCSRSDSGPSGSSPERL